MGSLSAWALFRLFHTRQISGLIRSRTKQCLTLENVIPHTNPKSTPRLVLPLGWTTLCLRAGLRFFNPGWKLLRGEISSVCMKQVWNNLGLNAGMNIETQPGQPWLEFNLCWEALVSKGLDRVCLGTLQAPTGTSHFGSMLIATRSNWKSQGSCHDCSVQQIANGAGCGWIQIAGWRGDFLSFLLWILTGLCQEGPQILHFNL